MTLLIPQRLLLAALLMSWLLPSRAEQAPPAMHAPPSVQSPPSPLQVLDELTVTGARTGPGMWRVRKGAAQLWILGSLSPLPKGITWRSTQAEQILAHTTQVLVQKPFEVSIVRILWLLLTERELLMVNGGKRLRDVMPADLYARFTRLRAVYSDDPKKWERFRPLIAAALLQQEAFHRVGLSMRLDLGASMRALAKQHHVRIEEVKMAGIGDVLDVLKSIPPAAERTCVDAALVTIEKDLPRLIDRADAWVNGNIERLESLPEPAEVDACRAALDTESSAATLIAQLRAAWLKQMQTHLRADEVTVAVVNLDLLLEHGGLLDELRAAGYDIEAPGKNLP